MTSGLPIEQADIENLKCPKCQSAVSFKTRIGHVCYLDRRNYDIESQVWKCSWCDLEFMIPVAKKKKVGE